MLFPFASFYCRHVSPEDVENTVGFEGFGKGFSFGGDLMYDFCICHIDMDAPMGH